MQRTVSIIAIAAACLLIASPGFAAMNNDQEQKQPDPQQVRCEALIKQFKRQNVGHTDRITLSEARRKLYRAEKMCQTNPAGGIKLATEALKDINVRPGR
jgi:hypothetical protein